MRIGLRFAGPLFAAAAALAASPVAASAPDRANHVDLQLVLAVDVSGSMDGAEQRFQREGYVEAFQNPDVLDAIRGGPYGRIAVTYMEWSSATYQKVVVPWRVIGTEDEVMAFAYALATTRSGGGGRTSLSGGLLTAATAFAVSGVTSTRRAIDISSDGVNNDGIPVQLARDSLVRQGITINGLPILITSFVGLDTYFADNVAGGPGSFVIPVSSREDFVPALRRKLVLEIAGGMPRTPADADTAVLLPVATRE